LLQEPKFTVTGLPENEQFEFRVKAVNTAGPGEPSRSAGPVLIQDGPGRPTIDLGAVKDIAVKAGEPFSIRVPYSGNNPKPTATFFNNELEIFDEGDRVKIEVQLKELYVSKGVFIQDLA